MGFYVRLGRGNCFVATVFKFFKDPARLTINHYLFTKKGSGNIISLLSEPFLMKVCRRIGGMYSGMPNAPARLSCVVVRPPGRVQVYHKPGRSDALPDAKSIP